MTPHALTDTSANVTVEAQPTKSGSKLRGITCIAAGVRRESFCSRSCRLNGIAQGAFPAKAKRAGQDQGQNEDLVA